MSTTPESHESDPRDQVVALIPAAGRGSRLPSIPGSKEVFPIGFAGGGSGPPEPKVVCEYLLERLVAARIARGIVVLRRGKWDIPAHLGDGARAGLSLGYVVVDETLGPPDSIDRAYPFVRSQVVAFGFPDILLGPPDVFARLLARLEAGGAEVVLGLYDIAGDPRQLDAVEIDETGRVRSMALKDPAPRARHCWMCAVWRPGFTDYLHDFVARMRRSTEGGDFSAIDSGGDLPMGLVFKSALADGMSLAGVSFPGESVTDVGTPEALARAAARLRGGEPNRS